MTDTTITTARLILRPPVLADLEPGYALATAPETTRFIGAGTLPDPETHWMKSLRDIGHWAHFGYGIFTVTDRADTRLLGKVGLSHFARGIGPDFDPFPEASWIMAAETHGKGLAHEAVAAAHDWFRTRNPGRTVCIIDPENAPSRKLAARLGYHEYGTASYRGSAPVKLQSHPLSA